MDLTGRTSTDVEIRASVGCELLNEIRAFAWSEAGLVLIASTLLAGLLGWLLSEMLVAMLQHVFDPPPDHLAVPWRYLGELLGGALLGAVLAVAVAGRGLARMNLGAVLREE